MQQLWLGYLQPNVSDGNKLLWIVIDALLVGVVVYFLSALFASKKGARYLSALGVIAGVFILAAYVNLPALHLLARASAILLLVGLPILFRDEILALLETDKGYLSATLAQRLVIATAVSLLFVMVTLSSATKVTALPQEIPIQAVNLAEGMSARISGQGKVGVLVSAPRDAWQSITTEAFSATVDVARQPEGGYDMAVTIISKSPQVKILRVSPARVFVNVEPVIKKTVPVAVRFSGKAGNGLVPDDPKVTPEKVEVAGPKSVVSDVTQAIALVRLNGETAPFEQKVLLVAEDSLGESIRSLAFSPTEVTVGVALVVPGKTKTVGIRPVVSGAPATGYWVNSVRVDPAVISITGSAEQLATITDIPTSPINVNGLSASAQQQVTLVLPAGITAVETVGKVAVSLTIAKSDSTKTVTPEIVYVGLSESLKVQSIAPTSITAILSGPTELLTTQVGKVNLDLSAYKSAGKYSVVIKNSSFSLAEGLRLVSFLPSAIDVTLENR